YNIVMNSLASRKGDVSGVWNLMIERGVYRDIYSYNALLKGMANTGAAAPQVREVLQEMTSRGISGDCYTAGSVVRVAARDADRDLALACLGWMEGARAGQWEAVGIEAGGEEGGEELAEACAEG
ncbi:hypothetical protein TrRE_jg614, partial [Triparma retinervis]